MQQFITDYEGVLFSGNRENSFVLWCFRREYVFLPQEEWEKVDAPVVERRLNFRPEQVKIVKARSPMCSSLAGEAGANGIKKKSVVLDDNLGQPTLIVKSLVIF